MLYRTSAVRLMVLVHVVVPRYCQLSISDWSLTQSFTPSSVRVSKTYASVNCGRTWPVQRTVQNLLLRFGFKAGPQRKSIAASFVTRKRLVGLKFATLV